MERKSNGMWRGLRAAACLSVSALAISVGSIAHAQDAATGQDDREIVVTAQFRETKLQDTPIAITAVSGTALEDRGLSNVRDLASIAPNVNVTTSGASQGPAAKIFIRGIGQSDSNFAYEPGVGVYIDDVYYGVLLGSSMELLDLDHVEVLRGPQGTTAGKNSIGGALKLYSRKPSGSNSGSVSASYGSYNRVEFRGSYDIAIVPDKLAFSVAGMAKRADGFVKRIDFACAYPSLSGTLPVIAPDKSNCQLGTLGGQNIFGIRGALRWTPSDFADITVTADYSRDKSEAPAGWLAYVSPRPTITSGGVPYDTRFVTADPHINYATFMNPKTGQQLPPDQDVKMYGFSGDAIFHLSENVTLRSITSYRNTRSQFSADDDASPVLNTLIYSNYPYHQFTQEVRLSSYLLDHVIDLTVGGYYFKGSGVQNYSIISAPVLNFTAGDVVRTESKSAFAQAIVSPTDRLKLTLGIRYTKDNKYYRFERTQASGAIDPTDGVSATAESDNIDYRLGADFRINNSLMVYGSFATGYKGGGVNPRPFDQYQVVPFKPEYVNAFELGFKADLFDRMVRFNAAAFLNKYKDIILINRAGFTNPDKSFNAFSAQPINAGNADIKGLEAELDIRPVDGLQIYASGSYLDFKYTKLSAQALASSVKVTDVAPYTPKWKLSAGLSYEIPIGHAGTLTPRIDYSYSSGYYTDAANHVNDARLGLANVAWIPGYGYANAQVAFENVEKTWRLTLSVSNITDNLYWTDQVANTTVGSRLLTIAPPREWKVTVTRQF